MLKLFKNVRLSCQVRRDLLQKSWAKGVVCGSLTFQDYFFTTSFPNQSGQIWNRKECSARNDKPFLIGGEGERVPNCCDERRRLLEDTALLSRRIAFIICKSAPVRLKYSTIR